MVGQYGVLGLEALEFGDSGFGFRVLGLGFSAEGVVFSSRRFEVPHRCCRAPETSKPLGCRVWVLLGFRV